jgi:hypothetical protein
VHTHAHRQQVQQHSLIELAAASAGRGSVLVHSRDLQQRGVPAVTSHQLQVGRSATGVAVCAGACACESWCARHAVCVCMSHAQ